MADRTTCPRSCSPAFRRPARSVAAQYIAEQWRQNLGISAFDMKPSQDEFGRRGQQRADRPRRRRHPRAGCGLVPRRLDRLDLVERHQQAGRLQERRHRHAAGRRRSCWRPTIRSASPRLRKRRTAVPRRLRASSRGTTKRCRAGPCRPSRAWTRTSTGRLPSRGTSRSPDASIANRGGGATWPPPSPGCRDAFTRARRGVGRDAVLHPEAPRHLGAVGASS